MATPLYKHLKSQGTTIYAFPGAEEDLNQIGDNYKLHFSKFVLLNLPKSQTSLSDEPKYWDFDIFNSASPQPASNFADRVVNSLRNYVANHEVTIRNTKISDNEYFYDNSVLQTNTEKIFFKWLKKLNLIQFEPAISGDEYFGNLDEFDSNDINDNEYVKEFLWKEREIKENYILKFYESSAYVNKLEVEYRGDINYKINDFVEFKNIENMNFPNIPKYAKILDIILPTGGSGYIVIFDITYIGNEQIENVGYSQLVYNKLVRYIGEVQGNNNVNNNNISYNQIMSFISDNAGETPDILFRTMIDNNYSPDLRFPILPSQYQPEIIGSEHFNSPLVNNPMNYPGDQYAQYDNDDNLDSYDYLTKSGDSLRKTGDYFGVTGDINSVEFDGSTIDGIQIDFDTNHYVKMNILNEEISNFDEFNTKKINNKFPKDFEFNAILWYYTVEDVNGNKATNLYGISFIDHPDNNEKNPGEQFPTIKKIVATDMKDGISYQFTLNKHTIISTENVQPVFDNSYVNNLFGFDLFNEAMKRLVIFNQSVEKLLIENSSIINDVTNLKQLIYSSSDLETIKFQISKLNELLKLYSTNQLVNTESIKIEKDDSSSPPSIKLYNIEGRYTTISNIKTSDLYDSVGNNIPTPILVPDGKDFLINITNDDKIEMSLNNDENLILYLNKDLSYKQTVEFMINGDMYSTENKKLNLMIEYSDNTNIPILKSFIENIDLPVYYNTIEQNQNTAYKLKYINQNILSVVLNNDGETVGIQIDRINGLKKGDTFIIDNVFLDTDNSYIDISSQYTIDSITESTQTINIDYTENYELESYIKDEISNGNLIAGDTMKYNSLGLFRMNKGYKITLTRIEESDDSKFEDRYLIRVDLN